MQLVARFVIAQGPLTNIATLIKNRPDLKNRIVRIVFVGGKHPGQLFHPGDQWWFHFGDLNVSQDPRAAEAVLYSGIPLTLIPFELATNLVMTPSDLELLRLGDDDAKWLSEISQHWSSFWEERLGRKGFYPFDALAVSYVATPEHFECRNIHARIGFSVFLAPFVMGRDLEVGENLSGPSVIYCFDLDREFKGVLLTRLMGESGES